MLYSSISGFHLLFLHFTFYFFLFIPLLVPVHYAPARWVARCTSPQASFAPCTVSTLYFWITGLPCPPRFHPLRAWACFPPFYLCVIFFHLKQTKNIRQAGDLDRYYCFLLPTTSTYGARLSKTETYVKLSWTRTSGDR